MKTLEEQIQEWHKFRIWGDSSDNAAINAVVLRYIIRCLSKKYIPSKEIVEETLLGRRKIPQCGFLACCLPDDGGHVH